MILSLSKALLLILKQRSFKKNPFKTIAILSGFEYSKVCPGGGMVDALDSGSSKA